MPNMGTRRGLACGVAVLLFAASLWQLGGAALIAGKAWLAPVLIERAWHETIATGAPVNPWPWADTYPLAELGLPGSAKPLYVLAGEDMRALAFGPVSLGGEPTVVFGHRDTHFNFLDEISVGDVVTFRKARVKAKKYRVGRAWVAHKDAMFLPAGDPRALLLVTCYPLGMQVRETNERYIVYATLDE
jgi:sortase A